MNHSSKKHYNFRVSKIVAVAGIITLFIVGISNSFNIISKGASTDSAEWKVKLTFTETSGKSDYITFGEATDAYDGPPADSYDTPKSPPPPSAPYIWVWFDDGLPGPYTTLWADYRKYSDTSKTWNLNVTWTPSDSTSPTDVTITWSTFEVISSEYASVVLYDYNNSVAVAEMTSNSTYSYNALAMTPYHFQVIATNNPPDNPSNPSPEDGETNVDIDADLSWTSGDQDDGDVVTYDVYFGTDTPPPKIVSEQSGTSFDLGTLSYDTTYYWQIVAWDNHDASTAGLIWSFTTVSSGGNGGNGGNGEYPPTNTPPTANASASERFGFVGALITFNGSLSADLDGYITNWSWDFGDNTTGSGEITTHAYAAIGTYIVTLTVTDNDDASHTDTITVVITKANKAPTKPVVNGPTTGNKNTEYTYTVVSTDEDNDTIKYTFDWDDDTTDESSFLQNGTSFTINHSWTAAGRYIVTVTVTDNKTDSSTELTVYIDAVTVGDIGYLIDIDGDEIYDSFHNATTGIETPVEKQDNGTYLIDVDGDGTWNYNYDPIAGTITTISEEESTTEEMQWAFIAVISIAIIIIAAIVYFYKKEYF